MQRWIVAGIAALAWWVFPPGVLLAQPALMPDLSERDPQAWINAGPLTLSDFRGQVVLIEVWTFT